MGDAAEMAEMYGTGHKLTETDGDPEAVEYAVGELTEYDGPEIPASELTGELVRVDTTSMVAVTDDEPREETGLALPAESFETPAASASTALALAEEELEWLTTLSMLAAKSGLYPGQKQHELMMKAMVGLTVGLQPAQAFQHIAMIRGNPSFGAELQRSLLKRWRLQIKQIRPDGWQMEDDQKYCLLNLVDLTSGEVLGEASFTIQEAQKAMLMRSDAWQKWTSDMLFARASTRLITRFCPWVLFQKPEDLGQ